MPKSNYLIDQILQFTMKGVAWTPPTTYYVALCKVLPAVTDTGSTISEVVYTGYARVAVAAAAWTFSSHVIHNTASVTFGNCTGGTDTANAVALLDAATGGNLHRSAALTPLAIASGLQPFFGAGSLAFTEA